MDSGFAHRARALLQAGGLAVDYHEFDGGHHIHPDHLDAATAWLERVLGSSSD